ncbi:cell envelope integrity protein TolA [Paraburkholderia megapolitana]|uniref:Cell division and transport-associated protein TolA n=1 Tax=Paraburkholderia megapolitana TaxID=420953 RepID=A0A1I3GD81_9BURK|nr:cell envelope integrity protein TolA [Paraburkholderia megapolitana]QDQ82857.1 cell envelope integrity protein TolA [Paraburkholderia megapolitana]SFI21485.1 Cell division and transport-associated protein TolA [Paraburkholderia megapolitana]
MKRQESSYPLQPPRERGTGRAIALAVVMHLLLGYFLYHGIQWQNSTPAGAEAELWTEVPDTVLPRPVVTPPIKVAPPPVDNTEADIALQEKKRQQQEAARQAQLAEQQRQKQQADQEAQAQRQQQLAAQAAQLAAQKAADAKQKQQQQQADKLRQQQLADQQKQDQLKQAQADAKKKADADKLAKAKTDAQQTKKLDQERRARLAQMQGLAGGGDASSGDGLAKSGTGSGSGGTAASAGYAEKVQRRVRPNIVWAGDTQGLETVVAVHCAPTGTLLSATVTRSSGNAQWDDAALRAVQRSDPMPLDTNGKTPASFTITLRPAA